MPENIQNVSLDDLALDPENPRLPTTVKRDPVSMLQYIARTSSITELMTAIGQHGYFPGEPLIVVPSGKKSPKYLVVEGNRRLTALKLLANPDLMPKNASIRTTAAEAEHRPTHVPCIRFDARDEVINYLGYRHITGIKQWEPLAKARYIAQYFDTQTPPKASAAHRYRTVARSIGSRSSYIKRQLDGIAVFNFIEQNSFFDIDDLDEENIPFSLLTTALGYESVLSFVSGSENPYVTPSKIKKEPVRELSVWLFEKDEKGDTLLGDSRNIKKLALIVENTEALKELRAGASLDTAYNKTRGLGLEFSEVLVILEQELGRALSMVALLELDSRQSQRIKNIRKQAVALDRIATSDDE
ncbi:ParB N-terminal domain-containing protein [Mesorhizobium australicum]|uniref:ParB N-terminal domain-containing protein n=1 Tax=Mesorhizobium australicum TaxID=536018 RepID=UPI003338CEFD